jgi:arylsulfatase A-like enzyme
MTAAVIVGLAWGLAFGAVDALPALLEGNPATDLAHRLLSLTYVAVFDALAFGLVLALVGLVGAGISRLTRRQVGLAGLLGLSAGLCAALSTAGWLLHHYQGAPWVAIVVLALAAGLGAGWLVGTARKPGSANVRSPGKPGHWRGGVLGIFGACIAALLATAVYHGFIRDLPLFNPRVTDQVATPQRPDIVLISIDALRADRLGVYGNNPGDAPHRVSPNIDALARQGIVFQQATSQGSSTVPSVSSFLTSLYPTEVGIFTGRDWFVDDARVTLAEALQVAGYRTQAYVGNGHLVAANGYAQGFDGYVAPEPNRPYGLDRLRNETVVAGLACRYDTFVCDFFDGGYRLLFDRFLVMEDEGGRINDQARRFIRLHGDEQFFLWLHYMEPHAAYRPQQAFGGLPASVDAEREAFLREWQPSNKTWPTVLRPDDVTALRALYDGEILDVDGWVSGIWDEIQAQGLADRTLLVLTADHGDEFGEHGDYGHGHTVYQELDWVPLIVVAPQVAAAGRVVQTPVPLLDIMPTLLDVAGAPLPDPIRGQSLLPVLQGAEPPERPIYSESPARRSSYDRKSLRLGDYKLVYDLRADPGEQHDLAAADPGRAAAMRDDLRAWTSAALETWAALPQSGHRPGEMDAAIQNALRQIGY